MRPPRIVAEVALQHVAEIAGCDVDRLEVLRFRPERADPERIRRQSRNCPDALLELLPVLLQGALADQARGEGHRAEHAPRRHFTSVLQIPQRLRHARQDFLQDVLGGHPGQRAAPAPRRRLVGQLLEHVVLVRGRRLWHPEQLASLHPQGADSSACQAATHPQEAMREHRDVHHRARVVHGAQGTEQRVLHFASGVALENGGLS
mmetsp:Transcript_81349/g.235907  ORF Transcript_81349/g.235907 Transcript_81349/m.235907 type:complete len:205 (+) Transcript_81349:2982-3596(+)